MCNEHSDFVNGDCNHVATGDISIIKNQMLRKILIKGPGFREPVTLDFDDAHRAILDDLYYFVYNWSNKEKVALVCFDGWKSRFRELLTDMVNCLKQKYSHSSKEISVFSIPSVKTELEYFHKYFVICPVDKASKNVSIICKRFYLEPILNECIDNSLSYDHIVNLTVEDICKKQNFLCRKNLNLISI